MKPKDSLSQKQNIKYRRNRINIKLTFAASCCQITPNNFQQLKSGVFHNIREQ